jgi:hypothetical protein
MASGRTEYRGVWVKFNSWVPSTSGVLVPEVVLPKWSHRFSSHRFLEPSGSVDTSSVRGLRPIAFIANTCIMSEYV